MSVKDISLDDWVEAKLKKLEGFKRWWNAKNKDYPTQFPEKMWPGEWDEQIQAIDFNADGDVVEEPE